MDHINGNVLDNRKCNLRVCTKRQNYANSSKPNTPSYSKYKGVTWDKSRNKWFAQINVRPNKYNLGRFESEIDAAKAYNRRRLALFWRICQT